MGRLLSRREWALVLSFYIVFLFHIGPYPGVNENRYLDLIRSLVDDQSLTIDRYHYNTVDKSYHDGHYYAGAAPGIAFMGAPVYFLIKQVLAVKPISLFGQYDRARYIREEMGMPDAPDAFVNQYPISEFFIIHMGVTAVVCGVPATLTLLLLYRLLGRYTTEESTRIWICVIYGFGSISFFYAVRLLAHIPSAFFVFLSFYLLLNRTATHAALRSAGAGFGLGMGMLVEYTVLPVVAVLGLFGLYRYNNRERLRFIIAGAVPVAALMIYHTVCFGGPFTTAYTFPMSPDNPGPHSDLLEAGVGGFGMPSFQALWGLSFSGYRGVFLYMPVCVLSIYGMIRVWNQGDRATRLPWILIGLIALLQFIFNSMMIRFWSGGYIWGPRYLIPALPFLMIGLAPAFRALSSRVIIPVGLLSILINWTATQYIVPQHVLGGVSAFLLSGPTTQFYHFLSGYAATYGGWPVTVSPYGGWLIVGATLYGVWRFIDRPPEEAGNMAPR